MGEDLFSQQVTIRFSRQTLLHGTGLEKFETIVLILHHTAFWGAFVRLALCILYCIKMNCVFTLPKF
jgi:hypothetical protein